jgi:hypothetical protein
MAEYGMAGYGMAEYRMRLQGMGQRCCSRQPAVPGKLH